jgi:hypothetical protein
MLVSEMTMAVLTKFSSHVEMTTVALICYHHMLVSEMTTAVLICYHHMLASEMTTADFIFYHHMLASELITADLIYFHQRLASEMTTADMICDHFMSSSHISVNNDCDMLSSHVHLGQYCILTWLILWLVILTCYANIISCHHPVLSSDMLMYDWICYHHMFSSDTLKNDISHKITWKYKINKKVRSLQSVAEILGLKRKPIFLFEAHASTVPVKPNSRNAVEDAQNQDSQA